MIGFGQGARRRTAAAVALAAMLGAGAAGATDFKPDATGWWVVRTNNMAQVLTRDITVGAATDAEKLGNKDQLVANMALACDGLQGEQMKNEYGKVPRWALGSQLQACSAMQRWSGKAFMTSKVPCKDVEAAIKGLQQAKPGDDPPEAVAAANALIPTLQRLLGAAKSKDVHLNLRCSYG
jgi:hypothetical protein